ncbi:MULTISPECIES: sirohydrochlorin chelatase [unclassified Corynebacterium]|uniref:sirohydrochlorin chelatase n=1 Tax=unclassified Corynebacterium TaxID=2624378 RepID=UPI0029CA5DAB|nr:MULTISPECIES: sirohydrochlorin chelatase [unclassified Corynebacterium]WPF65964.1 sirohydrochlorin chelatase [Corynebacterium sp. 22KM0430]WPF68457.1 sirohydrochlorin chelatase [Corynebacterium sp. 21KM1197]
MTLITLAHGSRHPLAGEAISELTAAAGALLGAQACAAHLELCNPSLPELAARLVRCGECSAVVVPLLFTRAYHARHDVPRALRAARESGLDLTLAPSLGLGLEVESVVARVVASDADPDAHLVFYSVGSSQPGANAAVAALCSRVARRTGRGHTVVYATGVGPGVGIAGLHEAARRYERLHLVPLFVAPGLLLDKALAAVPGIAALRGATVGASRPLGALLAPLVRQRYLEAGGAVGGVVGGAREQAHVIEQAQRRAA